MNKCTIKNIVSFFENENIYFAGSGTSAIVSVLETIDCSGKNVILPAMTCPNIAIAVYASGANPIYIDIDENTGNMDIRHIRDNIDSNTCALIAVHSFGYPCDIHAIRKEFSDIIIIEDACQAYGGKQGMNPLGTLGDCGIISFGYSKPLAMGMGAAIIVNNTDLLEKLHYVATDNNTYKGLSLDTLKHKISLRLALKEHNKLLRFLAQYFHLYTFNASPEFYKNIPSQWHLFEKNIPALKSQLFELSDLITHDKIKKLDYRGRDWLPWRYSFHIEDDIFLRKFRRIGKENHITVSRLYKPIVKHFDNDENCACTYPRALNWSRKAVNLVYNHTLEDVDIIKKNIKHVITSTAEALE